MTNPPLHPKFFAARLIALFGGQEAARKALDDSHEELSDRWEQDAALMGRILRAHLFVEHYLGRYLATRNPNLGALDDARLSFAQKIALADRADPSLSYVIPGVLRLNKVRNRLAHTLHAEVTIDDRAVFLSTDLFRALRDKLAEPNKPSEEPIDVLEEFARHVGIAYASASDPHRELWVKAHAAGPAENEI